MELGVRNAAAGGGVDERGIFRPGGGRLKGKSIRGDGERGFFRWKEDRRPAAVKDFGFGAEAGAWIDR